MRRMASNPPDEYREPARKKNLLWVWLLVLAVPLLACGVCLVGLVPGVRRMMSEGGRMASCAMNLKAAHSALLAYAQENQDTLPPAATWQTAIAPYLARVTAKSRSELEQASKFVKFDINDGSTPLSCQVSDTQRTGIAMNDTLGGKKLASIEKPLQTVLLFETDQVAMNNHGPYSKRPENSGPKVFGKPRDWLEIKVDDKEFDASFKMDKGGGKGFDLSPEAARSKPEAPQPPAVPEQTPR